MVAETGIVAVVLLVAGVLFVVGRPPLPVTALGMTGVLLLLGILTPQEAVGGLGHPATLVIICMFILAAAVSRTGLVDRFVHRLVTAARGGIGRFRALLFGGVAGASAVMNNTPVVAMSIPVVSQASGRFDQTPSRLLLPVSYAAMLGGLITLFGTRANIVASELLRGAGLEPFGVFEWTWLGLTLTLVGLLYLLTVGFRLMPWHGSEDTAEGARTYLCEAEVADALAGKKVDEVPAFTTPGTFLLQVERGGRRLRGPVAAMELKAGDRLLLRGDADAIKALHGADGFTMLPEPGPLADSEPELAEVMVPPGSPLVGRSLASRRYLHRFLGTVLGVRKGGTSLVRHRHAVRFEAGDLLLVRTDRGRLLDLQERQDVVVVSRIESEPPRRRHATFVLAVLAVVVLLPGLGLISLPAAALAGALAVLVSGTVGLRGLQESVRWDVVLILAGTVPVGTAMVKTGLAATLAEGLGAALDPLPAWGVVLGLYVATGILTALVTNTACVVLMAPIAFGLAAQTGLDPRILMAVVMVASSADFNTPIGYETNTMVSGPGEYRFRDYLRAGLPLTLLVATLTTVLLTPLAMS